MRTTSHVPLKATTTSAWNTTGMPIRHRSSLLSHTHFYWGHTTQILFPCWPGSNQGMYALALFFVFSMAVLVEWLTHWNFVKPGADKVATGFFKAALHAVRSGLHYMVILAVASFNGGVFLAATFGHAVGYLIFGSQVFKKSGGSGSK